jgi:uncharacterized protein (DUF1501 family)
MCNHHKNDHPQRPGSSLKNEKAHQNDHLSWSRRSFIRNLGLVGGVSLFVGKTSVTALATNPLLKALNNADSDRILVLIRLKGGNDGLNTIIPLFDYGTYQQLRPTIRIPENQVIQLNDAFGIPSYMSPLESLWNDGQMKVINSVGYPEQNLSHFRSSDIWASASDSDTTDTSGWLGRYLEQELPDFLENPPEHPPAVQIGGTGNLVFNNSSMNNMSMIVNDPQQLAEIAQNGQLYDVNDVPDCYRGEQLGYLRNVANSTFRYAGILSETFDKAQNEVEYSNNQLGNQLSVVARLIKGGLSSRLYMVTLDGFDTHAEQNSIHPYLLNILSTGIEHFFEDLRKSGDARRVLATTFSEFGRRIEQNASQGTDHGAAAPVMMFGPGLEGNGLLGKAPDLRDLDPIGNLKFDIDFRQIYASILENWLCIEKSQVDVILGASFDRLPGLGFQCSPLTSTQAQPMAHIPFRILYLGEQFRIEYELPKSMKVNISLFNLAGQKVTELVNAHQHSGPHQIAFHPKQLNMIPGQYVCSLQSTSGRISRQFNYF